jgi:enoyl-CoA hydratase/carnithine racemase
VIDFGGGEEIRFERRGRAGLVTLTRPKALNAVSHSMVLALSRALRAWEADDAVGLVVVTAEGRAFSAGGDIRRVHDAGPAHPDSIAFFADEYRMNAQLARFPKPYVSLIDGIVMGGGVGISMHGSHRVMTEKALFAMPEVGIGFFPDIGGSFILSRLKGSYGMYLGLTGARIRAGDCRRAGLATHCVASDRLEAVLAALCEEDGTPDRILNRFHRDPEAETDEGTLFAIARLFSRQSLADLMTALRRAATAGEEIAVRSLAAIEKASPTSVAVTFREIDTAAMLEFDDCMRMEFRIVKRMIGRHDFFEGVRAAVVDKDGAPRWRPATLAEVDDAVVESHFAPLPDGDLVL